MKTTDECCGHFNELLIELLEAVYDVTEDATVHSNLVKFKWGIKICNNFGLEFFLTNYYIHREHVVTNNYEFFDSLTVDKVLDNSTYQFGSQENNITVQEKKDIGDLMALWRLLEDSNRCVLMKYFNQMIICADFYVRILYSNKTLDVDNS